LLSIFVILCVIAILVALVLLRLFKKPRVQEPYKVTQDIDPYKIGINEIDRMEDGKDFEMYLLRLFLCLGYGDAYKTQDSRDFGTDLVFTDREGYRNVIQAKRYAISINELENMSPEFRKLVVKTLEGLIEYEKDDIRLHID
jgi:restriction system protein